MNMTQKIATIWPEIVLVAVAFAVMLIGLAPKESTRRSTFVISMAGLVVALLLSIFHPAGVSDLATYFKVATCGMGILLLMTAAEVPDESGADAVVTKHKKFDPADTSRGEFFGFFLLSLAGAMLCSGADDLVWLFLALELTSLPTYIMVSVSRRSIVAQEAGVKYFFLGAFSAAIFLYGFALIYGATGTTMLGEIHEVFARSQGVSYLGLLGLILAMVGICFKIAAVPMHMYAADVYQGAATPVSAFLAYVPKAAGFVSLILLLSTVGWPLDRTPDVIDAGDAVNWVLWTLAVLTMFAGNVLALLQNNVKRVLAYSSVAHTGYMLVGLAAGPGLALATDKPLVYRNGLSAVLFYLVAYGVMNLGAFAVLGLMRHAGEEAETYDDIRGLAHRRPMFAAAFAVCVLSLLGFPPLVGFLGKLYLLIAVTSTGKTMFYWLAGLMVLNSAIGAYYYLRMIAVAYLSDPAERTTVVALPWRTWSAVASALAVVALSLGVSLLSSAASGAADPRSMWPTTNQPGGPIRNATPAPGASTAAPLALESR